ncbi:MAG: hypothetical protein IPN98_10505 [Propionivibrio sp.]|nr:hypothetical protein [Propionivibrio sp.]
MTSALLHSTWVGQAVGLAVVLGNSEDATIRALYEWMKSQLAEHKMPVRWWVIDGKSQNVARQDQPGCGQGLLRHSGCSIWPGFLTGESRDER